MSIKLKWLICFLCICGIGYIGLYQLPNLLVCKKHTTKSYASRIIESYSIRDVLDYVDNNNTMVIFDLDNTLVYPGQDLGSDQWFSYMFNQKIASGIERQQVLAEVLPLFFEVHNHITLKPVESDSLSVFSTLHRKGITTIALTTRSLPMIERTCVQLKEAGLSFENTEPFNQDLSIQLAKEARLYQGIIFCNDNNKGQTLLKFLEIFHYKPQTIVFVDDKLSHLLDVEKECLFNKINFVGIRYGKLDDFVAQFNPARAEQQYYRLLGKCFPKNHIYA